jgi:hypothetical protein
MKSSLRQEVSGNLPLALLLLMGVVHLARSRANLKHLQVECARLHH